MRETLYHVCKYNVDYYFCRDGPACFSVILRWIQLNNSIGQMILCT